jgi:hypothetical protein
MQKHMDTDEDQRQYTATAHLDMGTSTDVNGRTERPGYPLHGSGRCECAEGGVNIVNAAMQSPGSIASQVLMTASHVSSLSLSVLSCCP